MTLSIIITITVISFIVIQFAFLGKKKLLGLLLPLICFIGSIGIIISQPIMTDLVTDGINNGSHYYQVNIFFKMKTTKEILLVL